LRCGALFAAVMGLIGLGVVIASGPDGGGFAHALTVGLLGVATGGVGRAALGAFLGWLAGPIFRELVQELDERRAFYEDSRQAPSGSFFGRRGPSTPPASCRFAPASCFSLQRILSPPPHSPSQRQGCAAGGERMLLHCSHLDRDPSVVLPAIAVGWRITRFGRHARTTVYPCEASRLQAPCTLRARLFPEPKRRSYHWLSALFGCQRSHSHASSTIRLRTCLFPALLIPCSRSLLPLS
jgi:hypothetical protein